MRALFIENRGAFLEKHKQQVEALRNVRGSVVNCLRAACDLLRTHVFDIGMQYKALSGSPRQLAAPPRQKKVRL